LLPSSVCRAWVCVCRVGNARCVPMPYHPPCTHPPPVPAHPYLPAQALSSGQVMTFRECLQWPARIKLDMETAGKTLNGEKLKLVEELDWRCERFVKTLAELTTTAQKVCVGPCCALSVNIVTRYRGPRGGGGGGGRGAPT
jgi:hypothetical protein